MQHCVVVMGFVNAWDACRVLGAVAQVANLQQNPQQRAVVSPYLPTLLRTGLMYLLINPSIQDEACAVKEERWLLAKAGPDWMRAARDVLVSCQPR